MAEDLAFLNRLADPSDRFESPPGTSAGAQLADAGKALVDYGGSVWANPHRVFDDLQSGANKVYAGLVPSATPTADTFAGEVGRMYGIGKNQGELAANIASLPAGGEALGPLRTLRGASQLRKATRYLDEAGHLDAVAYLEKPYRTTGPAKGRGKGDHAVLKERDRLPKILGGGPWPRSILDSPFNRVQFKGLTQGQAYALHAMIDDRSYGARLPNNLSVKGWSARKAGIDTQTGFDRAWNRTPEATKTLMGSLVGGAVGTTGEALDGDESW